MSEGRGCSFFWARDSKEADGLVSAFMRQLDSAYISHGEIMYGRAKNAEEWADNIEDVLREDILEAVSCRTGEGGLALAMEDDSLAGFAMIEIEKPRRAEVFAVLSDLVIMPGHRGTGIGAGFLAWIETELLREGVGRIFLESGVRNAAAHRFFNNRGFSTISVSMMKELKPAPVGKA